MNEKLSEEDVKVIFDSLENPKYKWRTIDGISKETGIDQDKVKQAIKAHSDEIVKSAYMSESGKSLYTTRSKFRREASILNKLFGAVKSRVE